MKFTAHLQNVILIQKIFCELLLIAKTTHKKNNSCSIQPPVIFLFACFIDNSFRIKLSSLYLENSSMKILC